MSLFGFAKLSPLEGQRVRLTSTDGEIMDVLVDAVFEEEKDLNYWILRTNRPERYAGDKPGTSYVIPWEYIAGIEPLE